MGTYTVTISPDESGGAEAVIRLEIENGTARVTELVVRPGSGAAIATIADGQLSAVDLELLLRAVQPAAAAVDSLRESAPAAGTPRPRRDPGDDPSAVVASGGHRDPRRGAEARRENTASRATAGATRRGAARKQPAPIPPEVRAYRKMPDDLAAVFNRIGSVTKLAAHYGVPRHTAQGWIDRLRKQADA